MILTSPQQPPSGYNGLYVSQRCADSHYGLLNAAFQHKTTFSGFDDYLPNRNNRFRLCIRLPRSVNRTEIQAAGAGIVMPLLTNVILALFPPEKRGGAMGMMGLAIIFAPAIGPTLAGYILENYSWETMFFGMIPLALIVIFCGLIFLKNVSERVNTKFDMLSVVLSTIGFGALLYGFSQAGSAGWKSLEVLLSIGIGIVSLALFTWRQLVSSSPLLDLRAFKYSMFSLTTIISIAVTMIMYADMMLLPLYLQNARGYTALESGFLLLPGALVMGFLMPVTGKLFDRYGAKWLAIIGMVITIVITLGFINLTDSTSYTYLLLMSTARRIGMAFLMMPIQTLGLNQLPTRLNAHGTAITNTIRQVAGGVGTSLLVTVMASRTKKRSLPVEQREQRKSKCLKQPYRGSMMPISSLLGSELSGCCSRSL